MCTGTSLSIPANAQAAVLDLYRSTLDGDEQAIFSTAIELAVGCTGSEIGYFHLVNEDQESLELGTWSAGTLLQCTAVYDRHYPISEAGVWADTARQRRPCIHNDYQSLQRKSGLPEGHVPLVRHLGVPVLDRDRVVLLVGVGNKPTDYDTADLSGLQAIADQAWVLIRRRRQTAALEVAERQLRDLQELAAISVWQWDPEEGNIECDRNAARIFGLEPSTEWKGGLGVLLRFIDARDHQALQEALRNPAEDAAFEMDLRGTRSDGVALTVYIRGAAYPRSQGHGIVLRGILQDVTERRQLGDIKYQATHDVLTGLANRAFLLSELQASLRNPRRRRDEVVAVHFVDLDHFKAVNDSFGHSCGDAVLKLVANRVLQSTRKEDLVARLGGDELVVLQKDIREPGAAEALATKIIAAISEPMKLDGHDLQIGASIGIATAGRAGESAEELLTRADRAMYRAKESCRGSYCLA